ncbi:hypothetical protein DNK10_17750 [Pseudomonas daroniae]|nr:hypothetical protein DNK10_17750 [Pseudomonas daroniae]
MTEWVLFVLLSFDNRAETHLVDGFSSKERCMRAGQIIGEEIRAAWRSSDKIDGKKMAGSEQSVMFNCKAVEK